MNTNVLTPEDPSGSPMERREFIVSTYKHLGAAILAFVVLSTVLTLSGFSNTTAKMLMASGNKFIWLGVMGAFMLVGWLASYLADNAEKPQTQLMGLGIYVLAEGLIFAPLFGIAQIVAPGAIGAAGFITLLMVAALTWTAFTSKSDFSFLSGRCFDMCLTGLSLKLRNFTDAEVKLTYEKIYNSHSALPCSNMPRFGMNKVLTIEQIKDAVALLMSPDSPVNKD